MQHERDARDLAEVGDVLDVQTGLGLFLVAHALGDRTVDGADGDAQPVALCLLCKLLCFAQISEALLRAENLFVIHVRTRALVAHDGAELGLTGDVICVGEVRDLLRHGNVLRKLQAAAVNHDGLIACLDCAFQNGHIVHAFLILVDDGYMVEVQQGVFRVIILEILLRDSLKALRLELFPFQPRDLQHGDGLFVDDGLRDGLCHRQIGDVECRDDGMVLPCQPDGLLCFHMDLSP